MIHVKICGITGVDQALAASAAGADYMGLVMAPSQRQILPIKALEIVKALREIHSEVQTAGVFVNVPVADVNFIAEACKLDLVQLSGDEDWQYCRNVQKPIIKAIHIPPGIMASKILENIKDGYRILGKDRLICLLDSHLKGTYGGSGLTFDWELAREVAARFPVFVAGGLNSENVGNLIEDVQPLGVDVSSGVETNGQKDIQKIKGFIRIVKNYPNR
jgi:phosphoribosylanthranilate isomerase